ncbi:MAG: glucuronate isomerase [Bacteroidales bacterium]|nr:glucuronate isomerase [Bacteroidales bacterium]
MKEFLDKDFLLETDTARRLYHGHAAKMPIIDYHCHLNPKLIAEDYRFSDLTEVWLGGDHYKWRAMRANGVDESYITGDQPSFEKFKKWAETLPYTMRNPLYHWTHLELRRIFGIEEILRPETADKIYQQATAMLQEKEFSTRGLMTRMHVELVCTTDDPTDSLEYHRAIQESGFSTRVLPTWRPDKAMSIEDPALYNDYLGKLEKASNISIHKYSDLLSALRNRHDFFAAMGCKLSDHGIETFYAEDYTETDMKDIFDRIRRGKSVSMQEILRFRSGMLYEFGVMDAEKQWAQQFHIGCIRNNNERMFKTLGPDTGFDGIGDFEIARAMNKLFSRLDKAGKLAKTILYNLNPRDNELMITNAYNFNDGSIPGKMQFGSGWWFLDQLNGMEKQINDLSVLGLLSRFVGMITDSRSFLSYPRHEYFRRTLCNLIGKDLENGQLPYSELPFLNKMVENIAYNNAKEYFSF